MVLGRFADLSEAEFVKLHLKYRPSAAKVASVASELSLATASNTHPFGGADNLKCASSAMPSCAMRATLRTSLWTCVAFVSRLKSGVYLTHSLKAAW
jgi:hypothetical protein